MHAGLWKLWKRVSKMRSKDKKLNMSAPLVWDVPDEPALVSDEPVTDSKQIAAGETMRPKRVITLKESDYAQLQSLVLKYGSGTGHGTSLSIEARVAVADAAYDWSKDEDTSRKAD